MRMLYAKLIMHSSILMQHYFDLRTRGGNFNRQVTGGVPF